MNTARAHHTHTHTPTKGQTMVITLDIWNVERPSHNATHIQMVDGDHGTVGLALKTD